MSGNMSLINKEYTEISNIFELEKTSFKQRREMMNNTTFSSIKWSSSYLDFFPFDSVINQLRPAVFYKGEKKTSIKNCYSDCKLIFACNNERENWGSLFIEYDDNSKKSLLFVEDDNENMALQQLRIAYFQNNRYERVLSYIKDEDNDEESLIVDLFKYDNKGNITKIIRHGFFEEQSKILPVREFNFTYVENKVSIFAKDEIGKEVLIYQGKKYINIPDEIVPL